jgi:protein-tyrosine phosphatase
MMQEIMTDAQRRIALEQAYNVREIGGYEAAEGRRTRLGRIFRGDSLHRLTPADQAVLRELGIRTIIDLRRDDEVALAPNVFAGAPDVTYRHISLFVTRPSTGVREGSFPLSLVDVYRYILDTSQAPLHLVLSDILASEGAVLFHCTAGKDRTGIVAALLLDLAGVRRDDIARDYALTEAYIEPLMQELRDSRPAMMPLEMYDKLLEAKPEFMYETLAYLDSAYGGSAGYLRSLGWRDEDISRLRGIILDI